VAADPSARPVAAVDTHPVAVTRPAVVLPLLPAATVLRAAHPPAATVRPGHRLVLVAMVRPARPLVPAVTVRPVLRPVLVATVRRVLRLVPVATVRPVLRLVPVATVGRKRATEAILLRVVRAVRRLRRAKP
jgi:hypothetical protein